MGIELIFTAVLDFVKLTLLFGIIALIIYKIFTPILGKIMDKYELSWVKAIFLLNLVVTFAAIMFLYLYFYYYGLINAAPLDVDLQLDLFERIAIIGMDAIRVFIGAFILAMVLLFMEFVSSMAIAYQKKYEYSELIKQFVGILFGVAVMAILLLFFFDWVPLGLFVYIFYGGLSDPPLLPTLILSLTGAIL